LRELETDSVREFDAPWRVENFTHTTDELNRKLNGGDLGERDIRDQRERRADE
jgi:hypothetical protein